MLNVSAKAGRQNRYAKRWAAAKGNAICLCVQLLLWGFYCVFPHICAHTASLFIRLLPLDWCDFRAEILRWKGFGWRGVVRYAAHHLKHSEYITTNSCRPEPYDPTYKRTLFDVCPVSAWFLTQFMKHLRVTFNVNYWVTRLKRSYGTNLRWKLIDHRLSLVL